MYSILWIAHENILIFVNKLTRGVELINIRNKSSSEKCSLFPVVIIANVMAIMNEFKQHTYSTDGIFNHSSRQLYQTWSFNLCKHHHSTQVPPGATQ